MPVPGDESLKSEKIEIADKLICNDKVSVIVILSSIKSVAMSILKTAADIDRKFIIIGSDGWGPDIHEKEITELVQKDHFSYVTAACRRQLFKNIAKGYPHILYMPVNGIKPILIN